MSEASKHFWNSRYKEGGNSGYGSYADQKDKKMKWLEGLEVSSVTSVGCGDFYFDSHVLDDLYPHATYVGLDESEEIIKRNKNIYRDKDFRVFTGEIPPADLIMCIDVLFHVYEDQEAEDLLTNLEKTWTKYLAVTAYEREEVKTNHVRIRKFDYKRFGEPVIRETVEEDGDLKFFLFKHA